MLFKTTPVKFPVSATDGYTLIKLSYKFPVCQTFINYKYEYSKLI